MQRDMGNGTSGWMKPELLPSVMELNAQCVDLLIHQARSAREAALPLPCELRPLLLNLDLNARRRVAACPFLLMDAGFADSRRWLWAHGYEVCEAQPVTEAPVLSASRSTALARHIFAYAWHLSRSDRKAARMILGMSPATADVLSTYTLMQTVGLAEVHPQWLQPRWPRHLRMWRDLLDAAMSGEEFVLEQARLRGVQLLAAEARSSAMP